MELKPCPWCGKKPTLYENKLVLSDVLYEYGCFSGENHSCSVGFYSSIEEAAEHWNSRVNDDSN